MSSEFPDRPNIRMSRFFEAQRSMPGGGSVHASLDERAEHTLDRDDAVNSTARWQRELAEPPSLDVIEVEFETVPPPPMQPDRQTPIFNTEPPVFHHHQTNFGGGEEQPAPPDIEAIAAALAEEMDRTARIAVPQPEPEPTSDPEPHETIEAVVVTAPDPEVVTQVAEAPRAESFKTTPGPAPAAPKKRKPPTQRRIGPAARRAAGYALRNTLPALGRGAFWLARNLRRKEIRRRYGKAVALVHGKVLDRRLERHFYLPSLDTQRFSPDLDRGIAYEGPVPAKAFAWVLSRLPQDLREYAFVDFRAGRGRAMLLAAQRNFDRIVGFEYGPALYDDLQMNLAQFPRSRMVCRNIQAFRADRLGVSVPDQPAVLYIANAWREELISGIMNYVRSSYTNKPRRLYLILENTDKTFAMPKDEIFHRLELPLAEKLKLHLFSPMTFQVYRSEI